MRTLDRTVPRRRRRLGLTLVEAAAVLAVTALVLGGFARLLSESGENLRGRATADRLREVIKASELYLAAYGTTLRTQIPTAGDRIMIPMTGGGPTPDLPSVQGAGFLSSAYLDSNTYGQLHRLVVRTVNNPAGGTRLEALVSTAGGQRIPDRQLGRIASFAGSQGGFYPVTPVGTNAAGNNILGVAGGWRDTAASWATSTFAPAPGSVQALIATADSSVLSDYLSRNDIGVPEANTLRTTVTVNRSATDKASKGDTDIIATDGELKVGPNLAVPGYLHADREVTAGTDVTAANGVKAGTCATAIDAAGNVVACNDVVGKRFVDSDNTSYVVDPAGASNVKKLRLADIDITETVVSSTDGDPRLQAGFRLRDLLPRYVSKEGYIVEEGGANSVPKPDCGPGGNQRVIITPVEDSFQVEANQYIAPSQQKVVTGLNMTPTTRDAVVDVRCSFNNITGTFTCDKDVGSFVNGLTVDASEVNAVTELNAGSIKTYRQLVAVDNGSFWNIVVGGTKTADRYTDTSGNTKGAWRLLVTSMCYY